LVTATKIEFFVGDVPEDVSLTPENARYTRLGYVFRTLYYLV